MIWWNLGGCVPNILKRFIWDSSPKLGQSTSLAYHPADPFQQVFVVTGSHIGSNLLILICCPSCWMTARPSWLEQNFQGRKTTTAGSRVSCPLKISNEVSWPCHGKGGANAVEILWPLASCPQTVYKEGKDFLTWPMRLVIVEFRCIWQLCCSKHQLFGSLAGAFKLGTNRCLAKDLELVATKKTLRFLFASCNGSSENTEIPRRPYPGKVPNEPNSHPFGPAISIVSFFL